MQGRLGIVVSFALNDLEAASQAGEAALIEVKLESVPRVSSA